MSINTAMPQRAWAQRYLELLQVDDGPPSLEQLNRITRAHLLRIPFENITSVLRRHAYLGQPVPPLDPDAVLSGWEAGQSGGVCFEVAGMISLLLPALGYRAHLALGAISFPGSHCVVVVEHDGIRYMVDAGNGAPFFEPVPLTGMAEVHRAGLSYRFRPSPSPDVWLQERGIGGEWKPFCRYDLRPATPEERETAYQRHHTPGQSWVVDSPRIIRCEEDAVYQFQNGEFTRYHAEGKRSEPVSDPAAIRRLAEEVFRLPGERVLEGMRAQAAYSGSR